MILIGIKVSDGKIGIVYSLPGIIGKFKKEFSILLDNIIKIRIQYNEVRDLFTIMVKNDSEFGISLNASIYRCERNSSFLDILCKDQYLLDKEIKDFISERDIEGLRIFLGREVADEIFRN